MTVKEIADKCGVSEQSIRAWCRRNNIPKVLQRQECSEKKCAKLTYLITDEVEKRICVYYAVCDNIRQSESEESRETSENEASESTEMEEITLLSALQDQINTLQQHNALLSEQITVKDSQIAAQQEQIKTLTESLRDTTAALTAAQALHAGTIKQQLTDKQTGCEGQSDAESKPEQQERQRFWQRIFKRS